MCISEETSYFWFKRQYFFIIFFSTWVTCRFLPLFWWCGRRGGGVSGERYNSFLHLFSFSFCEITLCLSIDFIVYLIITKNIYLINLIMWFHLIQNYSNRALRRREFIHPCMAQGSQRVHIAGCLLDSYTSTIW